MNAAIDMVPVGFFIEIIIFHFVKSSKHRKNSLVSPLFTVTCLCLRGQSLYMATIVRIVGIAWLLPSGKEGFGAMCDITKAIHP